MKTVMASEKEVKFNKDWYIVNAEDMILGRLAARIAHVLKGKHKPAYSPHYDIGDFVVVINADKIKLSGNKLDKKAYFSHSGYPGGTRYTTVRMMLNRHPERVVEYAVKGMLPKNSLGRKMLKKLKVYAGDQHPHKAQQPREFAF